MVLLFVLLVAMAWGYDQIFTGRCFTSGGFTATTDGQCVFHHYANQRIVVADLIAGRVPDATDGNCQTALDP